MGIHTLPLGQEPYLPLVLLLFFQFFFFLKISLSKTKGAICGTESHTARPMDNPPFCVPVEATLLHLHGPNLYGSAARFSGRVFRATFFWKRTLYTHTSAGYSAFLSIGGLG